MRTENFTWPDNIYIETQGQTLDLHNDYLFRSFTHNIQNRSVSLLWHRGTGKWVDQSLPYGIHLEMLEVHYLKVMPRDPKRPFSEDDCLDCFGYDCDEEWADGQFWQNEAPEPDWRWSFGFHSGAEIIVGGERARVTLQP